MAIPASVTFYENFTRGSYTDPTYTAASPEIPSNQTWTSTENGTGVVTREVGGTGWASGQYVFRTVSGAGGNEALVETTMSSTLWPTNQSRVYIEVQGFTNSRTTFSANDSLGYEHILHVKTSAANVTNVAYQWRGTNILTTNLGISVSSTDVHCIEMILDPNNATESQRFRVRTWVLGGSPPSFTDATANSTSARNDNYAWVKAQFGGDRNTVEGGRIIVSNDIAEDLSNITEGGGSVPPNMRYRPERNTLLRM